MFITKGIIVDAGAALIQDPIYDDKIKVRIPEIHGYGELIKKFQEPDYTKDEDLPWCKIIVNSVNPKAKYPIIQYKAQTYAPADIVYVQIDSESPHTNYIVLGLFHKYSESAATDTSQTIYNGIDVSSIIANKVDFPPELVDPDYISSGNTPNTDNGDNPDNGSNGPWMQIVKDCKKAMSQQAGYYSQQQYKEFSIYDGTYKTRLDCSGFTNLCLMVAGVYKLGSTESSADYASTNKALTSAGWKHYAWSGYNKLQPGDIIANPGTHVEIFSRNSGDTHYVYTYGGPESASTPGENEDSTIYQSVWRPPTSQLEGNGGTSGTTTVSNATNYRNIFGYPFKKKQNVSCPYGKPGDWAAGKHTGIDLSGPEGTPIYAVGDGIVEVAKSGDASYGNYVIISHGTVKGEKLWTLYAHMKTTPIVKKGQPVKGTQLVNGKQQAGTQLGVRGNTGHSSGPHLHFEFRKGTNRYHSYTNPNKYISF